jgi:protein-L-isoaspartate(D-aspartate) O-methyltransferase
MRARSQREVAMAGNRRQSEKADEWTSSQRSWMVERQIAARGVSDAGVLRAMAEVPREHFVPPELARRAYDDAALPIGAGQTISQPYIVALMAEAAGLDANSRALEVGTGSGYAAAVFSRIAAHVYTVERHQSLAAVAARRFEELGYDNIDVAVRDGTLGWPEHAPYDAIIVAAGGPGRVPPQLLDQLAAGGRLIIPRGATLAGQDLVRIRRSAGGELLDEESLGAVRFVPLVGAAGWTPDGEAADAGDGADAAVDDVRAGSAGGLRGPQSDTPPAVIADAAQPFDDLETADLAPLLDRIGDARLVLLGEASHGTSEFYRMRARITRELIERCGFDFVAVEADWPDAAELDAFVRHDPASRPRRKPFQRFPRWMWANTDVLDFVHWLRRFNERRSPDAAARVGFHGLDLYSLHASMEAVLHYLDDVDPRAAVAARDRYGCLTPWQDDPALYGRAVLSGTFDKCEGEVLAMLNDLLGKRFDYMRHDGTRFADAVQNARLVVNAEKYYRVMYRGSVASWNLRDRHMFDTLEMLLKLYGPGARGVVWAHNSHLGDAAATAMSARGEYNVGQLVREAYGGKAHLVGFGTHTGTVAAAHDWGEPMQVMDVRPSHPGSYESLCHEAGVRNFILPLREAAGAELREAHGALREMLLEPRLERAIGVIYRPETERQSHYFSASLPRQFDEWVWFDESSAVTPIGAGTAGEPFGPPDTFPSGL